MDMKGDAMYQASMSQARIETTIGDLITAICDAAEEACVAERDVAQVTQLILMDLLRAQLH